MVDKRDEGGSTLKSLQDRIRHGGDRADSLTRQAPPDQALGGPKDDLELHEHTITLADTG